MRRIVAVLLGVTLAGSFGVPARAAAAPAVRMDLAPRTTVPAGWKTAARLVEPRLSAAAARTLTGATMTYELDAGLDGVHLGDDSASGCVALSSRATVCAATGALPVTTEPTVGLPIPVTAGPVAISRTGTLTVTLTAAGVAPVVRHATITVAQVLGLSWSDSGVPAKAAPGAAFVAAVRVETHGTMAG